MPVEVRFVFIPVEGEDKDKFATQPKLPIPYSLDMFPDGEIVFTNRSENRTLQVRLSKQSQLTFQPPVPHRGRMTLFPDGSSTVRLKIRKELGIRRRKKGAFNPVEGEALDMHQTGIRFDVFDMDADGPPTPLDYADDRPDDPDIMIEC